MDDNTTEQSGELIVGLVGPVGTDLTKVTDAFEAALAQRAYECRRHRLSEWFESGPPFSPIDSTTEYTRIRTSMDAGDRVRGETQRADIMAMYAVSRIINERQRIHHPRSANMLVSLKRPEEVQYLRRVYGQRFFLVSAYVPRRDRVEHLAKKMTEVQAVELVGRDEDAEKDYGQATIRAFELADLFLDATLPHTTLTQEVGRFLDLVLGSPLITPNQHEHAMFLAYASSLRSGDLSRQVGAVVATGDGTLIAEGANDAPRYGGGRYWPGLSDQRDIALGYDSNAKIVAQMADRIQRALDSDEPRSSVEFRQRLFDVLASSGIRDITEFGRAVHAEMDALMNCARTGVSTQDKVLYCTTFPCHNCVKHLLAAGIKQVWFIEPYPKSRALDLHRDSVTDENEEAKMRLIPFMGVGPRRYLEMFALRDRDGARLRRKNDLGEVIKWDPKEAWPRMDDPRISHADLEDRAVTKVANITLAARSSPGVVSGKDEQEGKGT